jgi:hypothetical protein
MSRRNPPPDWGFFAEPAPSLDEVGVVRVPLQPAKRRRVRLPSVKRVEKVSGKSVAAITYGADGSRTFAFGEPGKPSDNLNEWDREFGTTPSKIRQ